MFARGTYVLHEALVNVICFHYPNAVTAVHSTMFYEHIPGVDTRKIGKGR